MTRHPADAGQHLCSISENPGFPEKSERVPTPKASKTVSSARIRHSTAS